MVKTLPTTQETWVQSLGGENALEKEMATHSSILARRILKDDCQKTRASPRTTQTTGNSSESQF